MQEPSHTFELYLVAGVIYFAICFPFTTLDMQALLNARVPAALIGEVEPARTGAGRIRLE